MHHITGGTVYWALAPQVTPNWIFPFASLQYFSVTNLTQFQYLMYRPLYWFGPYGSTAPTVDYAMSPANAPVWSNGGKTVTVSLKGWKFNDGQAVDAQSVIFWMNMMKAEGCYPEPTCATNAQWAGTVPGTQAFPGNILSYSAPGGASGDTVVFNLSETFSTNWYLYNELSQISPMAEAWDVTSLTGAPGSGGCGKVSAGNMTGSATTTACEAVWKFDTDNGGLNKSPVMSGDLSTYATNKLWQEGDDGPWLLTGFQASSGQSTFTPNPKYSGPGKPIISTFVEIPYSSDTAEYNALAAGGKTAPDVGYLPSQNTPQKAANLTPTQAGANAPSLAANYNLVTFSAWQINYFPENFDSTYGAGGHAGAVFSQLYFRQALQELVNQAGIISTYYKGYGVPTYGPAPVYPTNPFVSSEETKAGGPYPFSETNAVALLKANGWTVKPGGTSVCGKAGSATGDCGANIPAGTPLKFQEVYASGSQSLTQAVDYEVSEWAKAGIQVSLVARPFDDVLKTAVACPVPPAAPTKSCQAWDMANWGGGWLYAPDYLPTGEEIFATGAGSNSGDYNNTENNNLIIQTNRNSSMSIFDQWENYLADQLPVIWQPIEAGEAEIAKNLDGVTPINALENLNPEYWSFTSTATP
jgi:peptide/nickel transport system substrate-binding protein